MEDLDDYIWDVCFEAGDILVDSKITDKQWIEIISMCEKAKRLPPDQGTLEERANE